jgi:prepilin-type N-terminal cleavage/methylation domain-containing protein
MPKVAFTLIELLIVVAILGIITAVGMPLYNGFISSSKEITAKNSLRSICLIQADYFSENSNYLLTGVGTTTDINTNLFGKKTLNENESEGGYQYSITTLLGGYQARATPEDLSSGLTTYCVDHTDGPPISCE